MLVGLCCCRLFHTGQESETVSAPSDRSLGIVDLNGAVLAPLGSDGALLSVFVFLRTDCPISNRYAPELRRISELFESEQVRFLMVYLDRDEAAELIRKHMSEYGFPGEPVRDPDYRLVDLVAAEVTPEAAVFDGGGQLIYRGRIDDRYVAFGRERPAPTVHDLEEVLDSRLSGEGDHPTYTRAVGCYISDLR